MSQLVKMKRRIKAIETIKKISNAMRLISRSFHTKMNKEKANLKEYQEEVEGLLKSLHKYAPNWDSSFFFPQANVLPRKLYIIVGAQKGLCGNYNTEITYWINKNKHILTEKDTEVIVIGKKTKDYFLHQKIDFAMSLPELKTNNILKHTQEIISILKHAQPYYTEVKIISSFPETFFAHSLKKVQLIPAFHYEEEEEKDDDYLWQNSPQEILDTLAQMCLTTKVHVTLFESLMGEQAARFIAMDNATRNANTFLDSMQLQYNKIRQAKITKELTELSANFMN